MDRVLRLINQKHHDGPALKSSILILRAIVLAFSQICTVDSLRPPALCIHPVFQDIFKYRPPAFMSSESFSRLLALHELFPLPPPTSHHRFIDAKLAAFNLKLASYELLCVVSMMKGRGFENNYQLVICCVCSLC